MSAPAVRPGSGAGQRLHLAVLTAEDMGVHVRMTTELFKRRAAGLSRMVAGYSHSRRYIYLSADLDSLGHLAWVAWHEAGHAALSHEGAQLPEAERDADVWAVARMFAPSEVAEIAAGGGDELLQGLDLPTYVVEHVRSACVRLASDELAEAAL